MKSPSLWLVTWYYQVKFCAQNFGEILVKITAKYWWKVSQRVKSSSLWLVTWLRLLQLVRPPFPISLPAPPSSPWWRWWWWRRWWGTPSFLMMTFSFEYFTVAVDIPNQLIVNRQIAEQSIYNSPAKGASCKEYARIVGVKSFRVIVRLSPIFLSPPPHLVSILAQINFPPKYRPTKKPDVQNRKKWLYF